MGICQYEFQFFDEFLDELDDKVSKLLGFPLDDFIKKNTNDSIWMVLKKATENKYILYSAHQSSWMYLIVIRCDAIYEKEIRKILFNICEKMEEEDDEDHRKEIGNVFGNADTHLKYLEQKYNISSLFGIDVY